MSRLSKGQGAKVSSQDRQQAIEIVDTLRKETNATTEDICEVLGISARTYYRWRNDPDGEDKRATCERKPSIRDFTPEEKQEVIERYNAPEVADKSISEAYFYYLDKHMYFGSESTVRRILRPLGVDEESRRDGIRQKRKFSWFPEELVATGPNQVYSWDSTPFRGAYLGQQYHLYVAVDIYSRYIVGAEVYEADNSANAIDFLTKTLDKNGIKPDQLSLHSDNGPSMRATDTLKMLEVRGVHVTHSRPRVSDDNAYSESLFSTLNIRKGLDSRRYASLEELRVAVLNVVHEYNNDDHHSGINHVTPAQRHAGKDAQVLTERKETLEKAKAKNPARWNGRPVRDCTPAGPQYLNPAERGATVSSLKESS